MSRRSWDGDSYVKKRSKEEVDNNNEMRVCMMMEAIYWMVIDAKDETYLNQYIYLFIFS